MEKASWKEIIQMDEELKDYYDTLAVRKESTAIERCRMLVRYLNKVGLTPTQLLNNCSRDGIKKSNRQLQQFINEQKAIGNAPGYLNNYVKAYKGFLQHNEIENKHKFITGNNGDTPTIEYETPLTMEQLKNMLNIADSRGRVIISMIAFSGLRPMVLADWKATNGLTLKHLPELEYNNETETVTFTNTPMQIKVPTELSKAKKYITLLCNEGMEYLKTYLEQRMKAGELLSEDSPLIIALSGEYTHRGKKSENTENKSKNKPYKKSNEFMQTRAITRPLREYMKSLGLKKRPYTLRKYFAMNLLRAEAEGILPREFKVFWMGHTGSIENVYTTNNGIPPELLKSMRDTYLKCEKYFSTRPQRDDNTEEILLKHDLAKIYKQLKDRGVNVDDIIQENQEIIQARLKDSEEQTEQVLQNFSKMEEQIRINHITIAETMEIMNLSKEDLEGIRDVLEVTLSEDDKKLRRQLMELTSEISLAQSTNSDKSTFNAKEYQHKLIKLSKLIEYKNKGWDIDPDNDMIKEKDKYLIRRVKE